MVSVAQKRNTHKLMRYSPWFLWHTHKKKTNQTNKQQLNAAKKKKKVKAYARLIQCFITSTANSDEFTVNEGSLALHIQNTVSGCQKSYSPSGVWVTDAVFPFRRELFLHA